MTVCIAAACEDQRAIVVASDRMLTAYFLTLEFDHPEAKIQQIGQNCVALSAGDALSVQEVIVGGLGIAAQFQDPQIELIVQSIKNRFVEVRKRRANDLVFGPRGLDFDAFYSGGQISRLPTDLAMALDSRAQRIELETSIIVAGVDGTGAHIFVVEDPGRTACYDRMGYHAVGSGHRHALLTLVAKAQHSSSNLNTTVFNVFAAKRAAELAPGVGQATEIRIITEKGVRPLSPAEIDRLDKILKDDVKPKAVTSKAVSKLGYEGQ